MGMFEQLVIQTSEHLERELADDMVGPWEIFWHLRQARAEWHDEELGDAAQEVLARLVAAGATFGHLDPGTGRFVAAEDQAESVNTAASRWRAMDRDPAPGEIGYLVQRSHLETGD